MEEMGKGVALSRHADKQPVGGPQGFHVKFAAGVFHPRGGEGKYLQLAVVGGGDGGGSLSCEGAGEDGHGQGGSLGGIRAGPQLVKEHQGTAVRLLPEGHNVGHMGGEGTEALLNALLIPDIREHLMEQGQPGVLPGGM